MNQWVLYAVSATIGWLAFPDYADVKPAFYVLTLLLPWLWAHATTRMGAGFVITAYLAVVARGIPASVSTFYGDDPNGWIIGISLFCGTLALHSGIAFALWHPNPTRRLLTAPLLLLIWTLNPAGFGNPLQAAGILFPSEGWWGLAATFALAIMPLITRWSLAFILILLILPTPSSLPNPTNWHLHDTHYPFGAHPRCDYLSDFQRHQTLQKTVSSLGYHLFPESVAGNWNPFLTASWQQKLQNGQTVLVGSFIHEQSDGLTNTIIELTPTSERIVYRQQQPIPFIMWRPWEINTPTSSFIASGLSADLPIIDGKRTAFLICYEHLISKPFLIQAFQNPQQLVAIASNWFTPSYIQLAQQRAVNTWADLFELPIQTAFNQ